MTAAPKSGSRREVAQRDVAECRPGPNVGKADAVWEETGKCTTPTAGVGVQASRERFAEITSGRSRDQQWVVQAAQTCQRVTTHSWPEATGLAHQAVVAKMGRQHSPSEGPVGTQCYSPVSRDLVGSRSHPLPKEVARPCANFRRKSECRP